MDISVCYVIFFYSFKFQDRKLKDRFVSTMSSFNEMVLWIFLFFLIPEVRELHVHLYMHYFSVVFRIYVGFLNFLIKAF